MEKEAYLKAVNDMNYLVYCVLNKKTPDSNRINSIDLNNLFEAANNQMLTAATAIGLEKAGIDDYNFTQALGNAIKKNGTLDIEMKKLINQLEKNGIWYMPLKGSVLKDYYPQFGMRQMSDIDILFDRNHAEEVKTIMENAGYEIMEFGVGHHDIYYKKPVCNIEMHWELFGTYEDNRMNEYYKNTKDRLLKDKNNSYGYHFSNEDFYLFMTAHEYKHFYWLGTGLRSVLDVYVFLKKFADTLNMDYIECELKKMGIYDFEKQIRELAFNLYGENRVTEESMEMYNSLVFSGVYGSIENQVKRILKDEGDEGVVGKVKYIMHRLFPPKYILKQYYPKFFENKLLLPLLPFYRLYKMLTFRKENVKEEVKTLIKYKK